MKTIYLEPDEEITSVIEKLIKSESDAVKFVVPKGATLLQSLVNLKLLKKKSEDLGKEIALVTSDKIGRNLASQVGLSVFNNSDEVLQPAPSPKREADRADKVRDLDEIPSIPGIKVNRYYLPKEEEEKPVKPLQEKEPVAEPEDESVIPEKKSDLEEQRQKLPASGFKVKSKTSSKNKRLFAALFALLFLGLVTWALYVYGPRAEATVYVRGESYEATLTLDGKTSVSAPNQETGELPLKLLSAEESLTETAQATGKKNVGEKAKGTITITNSWDQNPQPLVAGTRFVANDSGKVFKTVADVTVPGATPTLIEGNITIKPSTATVAVEADEAGDSYNIPASRFTIPGLSKEKQEKIYGQSQSAMTGGVTKELTVVSEDDIKKAKTSLADKLKEKALAAAKSAADSSVSILNNAEDSEITTTKVSAKAGDEVAKFQVEMSVKAYLLGYDKETLKSLANDMAAKKIADDRSLLVDENNDYTPKLISSSVKDGKASLEVLVNGTSYAKIDKEKIRKDLRGKGPSQAQSALAGQPAERIEIRIRPEIYRYLNKLPVREEQIKVIVKTE